MFNWLVSDTWHNLEPFNFELFEIELFDHLIVCIYKMCLQIIYFIIIIIMSCRQHGYPWPSVATSPYRFIASGRSSGLHPVSSQSRCMYVRAGRPAFARPYVGIRRSTSLMSSSLLLQQCPACLVRLTWIVFVMGGRWPYSWCYVGCCLLDLFNIARSILVYIFDIYVKTGFCVK